MLVVTQYGALKLVRMPGRVGVHFATEATALGVRWHGATYQLVDPDKAIVRSGDAAWPLVMHMPTAVLWSLLGSLLADQPVDTDLESTLASAVSTPQDAVYLLTVQQVSTLLSALHG